MTPTETPAPASASSKSIESRIFLFLFPLWLLVQIRLGVILVVVRERSKVLVVVLLHRCILPIRVQDWRLWSVAGIESLLLLLLGLAGKQLASAFGQRRPEKYFNYISQDRKGAT